jgi:hypothetical protein
MTDNDNDNDYDVKSGCESSGFGFRVQQMHLSFLQSVFSE